MDFNVSRDIIDKFKCSSCGKYLSQFPVYIAGEDVNICGRCPTPEEETYFRNTVYESFAQHLKFPCQYRKDGCSKELVPEEMAMHESSCFFKPIACPGRNFNRCDWEGLRTALLPHCRRDHRDQFLDYKVFELDLIDGSEAGRFIEHEGVLFIVSLNYVSESNILYCSVYHIQEEVHTENYTFRVVISKDGVDLIVQCTTTAFEEQEKCEIVLDSLKNLNAVTPVIGKIVFDETLQDLTSAKYKINDDLLSLLRCSICGEFSLPPIYQFENNTIRCDTCRGTAKPGLRNFNLNKIAEMLNYPCRNSKNGCDAILKAEKMRKHALICPFERQNCPLRDVGCRWFGKREKLKGHIRRGHQAVVVENGQEIREEYDLSGGEVVWKFYLIRIRDYLFRMVFCAEDDVDVGWKWVVQTVGYVEEKFKYEIEVVDEKGEHRLVMRQTCSAFSESGKLEDLFKDKNRYCFFNKDQMLLISESRNVIFRVYVFQK